MRSKKSQPNEALRHQRQLRGWSQQKVAELVGASNDMVSRWECGQKKTSPFYQEKLCEIFGKTAEELGFLPSPVSGSMPVAPVQENDANPEERSAEMQREITMYETGAWGTDISRRELLQDTLTTGVALVTPSYILSDSPLWERLMKAVATPSTLDETILTHLETLTRDCWRLQPDVVGIVSRDLLNYVYERLQTVTSLLENALLPSVRTRLTAMAAELAQILGQMFSHMNDKMSAEKYFAASLRTASIVGNSALCAIALGNMSWLPKQNEGRQMQEGLSLLQEAQRYGLQSANPVICSWLAAREAEIQANLHNEYRSLKALEQVTATRPDLSDRGNQGEAAYWVCFDPLLMMGYQGVCHLQLQQAKRAEEMLKEAVTMFRPTRLYQQPYILADLASALQQQNNLEEACNFATKALMITTQTRSSGHLRRVLSFRSDIEHCKDEPCVKALDEQIMSVQSSILQTT